MRELVTVILLSYKNVKGIYETVDSILNQDYENIEIIISDDGTPDFEKEEVKILAYIHERKRDNIKSVIMNTLKVNVGTVRNINSAIMRSNGKYIKLISAEDCLNASSVLTKYVDFMEQNEYNIVFAKMRGVTLQGEYQYVLASCESDYDLLKSYNTEQTLKRLFKKNFLPAPASFFDRELFDKYGMFKEDTRLVEDYPYWIYLSLNNVEFGYLDEVLIDYRLANSGAGSYSVAFMKDLFVIYNKYIFPYDKRFGIVQPIYNTLKRLGLEFYMSQAKWGKLSGKEKVVSRIKYFPFYVFVNLQNEKVKWQNKKTKKEK